MNKKIEAYGLLKYQEGVKRYNTGDYTQSLAARQFLPQVNELVSREEMADYEGENIKMILNGWFTHNVHNWIPNGKIHPLFVSFHMNSTAAPDMLSEAGIAYLKQHEPIGCRDKYTAQILEEKGIKAYFSGCLTLTLDNYKVPDNQRNDDIFIVDPFYNYPTSEKLFTTPKTFVKGVLKKDFLRLNIGSRNLKKVVSQEVLENAKYVSQELPAGVQSIEEKFAYAEETLKKYAKAKLVLTSRIHCALPCLAMGTPVIFLHSFNGFVDTCRFDGILELFNYIKVEEDGSFKANFDLPGQVTMDTMVTNLGLHSQLAEPLKEQCRTFING